MTMPSTALVLGVSGVTGTPFAEELLTSGWTVFGVSRRAPVLKSAAAHQRFEHWPLDLRDAEALRATLRSHPGVTHVFHCANAGTGEARLLIMTNLLDALEASAAGFRNINMMQGMKYYGCHLGPFRTPAREDDPRTGHNEFYYEEEDLVRRRAGRLWTWTTLRPHSVCGYAAGNPLNLALVLAVYGSLRLELGQPLWFPASAACFRSLFQVMDSEILARAAIHVSTAPGCANNIFNVSNGDIFRWQNIWPAFARYFGVAAEGPGGPMLADFLDLHRATWTRLEARHDLKPFPIEHAGAWVRGDYRPPDSRFACEYDMISDTMKIRLAGFHEMVSSEAMFLRLFDRFRAERIIP